MFGYYNVGCDVVLREKGRNDIVVCTCATHDQAAFEAQQMQQRRCVTASEHAEMVRTLVKPGAAILEQLDPSKVDAMHAAIGIAGEAGELLDGVKKHVIYNKPLDRENITEELGDLEFYMEQLRQNIGVTREETLAANMAKLAVRYNGMRYSDQAAQDRVDKVTT